MSNIRHEDHLTWVTSDLSNIRSYRTSRGRWDSDKLVLRTVDAWCICAWHWNVCVVVCMYMWMCMCMHVQVGEKCPHVLPTHNHTQVYTDRHHCMHATPLSSTWSWRSSLALAAISESATSEVVTISAVFPSCRQQYTIKYWNLWFQLEPELEWNIGMLQQYVSVCVHVHIYIQHIHVYVYVCMSIYVISICIHACINANIRACTIHAYIFV